MRRAEISARDAQFVGVQVDVTSRTEGTATGDAAGVPLLVKYDTRLREGKENVDDITAAVQVRRVIPRPCPIALLPNPPRWDGIISVTSSGRVSGDAVTQLQDIRPDESCVAGIVCLPRGSRLGTCRL